MKVGVIGLGKLGLPVAVTMATKHEVMGFDVCPKRMTKEPQEYQEVGLKHKDFNDDLAESSLTYGSLAEVVDHSEILFLAIQTPHEPLYEGITKIPAKRVDFDYSYIEKAIADIAAVVNKPATIVVISTVLPGTMRKRIYPLLNENLRLVYNPFFIAMGTVVRDYLNPEFILLGSNDEKAKKQIIGFYETLMDAPVAAMSIESAELTKVAYNTFISMKLGFANILLEIAHKSPGIDVDEVTQALMMANERLISTKYMIPGMGDGGGCHPRDNIALSWLSRELNLGHDIFESIMMAREKQAEWLADEMKRYHLPKCILGVTFKKETNITTGSHALLVARFLDNPKTVDPYVPGWQSLPDDPHVFLIGMNHDCFKDYLFPAGSVILDPWRYIPKRDGIEVVHIGAQ